jgi:[NiFe] hydrogenase diaphorase moiety large subunit
MASGPCLFYVHNVENKPVLELEISGIVNIQYLSSHRPIRGATMPEPSVQEVTQDLLAKWNKNPANLLQVLIGLQQAFHHVPADAINMLSEQLGATPAHIEGVIGYYTFLHTEPRGEYDILISNNIVDQMQGSREIAAAFSQNLQVSLGETRTDGRVSLGYTSCTGMSDQGPAALVNGHTVTRLTEDRVKQITALIEAQTPVTDWPDELFVVTDNIQRKDLLLGNTLQAGAAIGASLSQGADAILDQLEQSGLRGRGGAGFKTAMKWRFCKNAPGDERVVVCNADEGEPGTFKDRILLQSYMDRLIEGMTLCASVIDASLGFIYLRGEYLYLLPQVEEALQKARDENLLGNNILGKDDFNFDIQVHLGAGAYICGEESALIESLEGKRGIPRIRPPFPVTSGYLEKPTVVNNVETFVAAAMIAVHGAEWFNAKGTEESPGTKLLSISGDCQRPGIYEYAMGTSIQEILHDCGAVNVQAVQIAGPAGHLLPPAELNRGIAYEDLATGGSFMVFGQQRDIMDVVSNFTDFFVHESCGFCTPCRVGSSLLKKRLDKVIVSHATTMDLDTMRKLGTLMREGSNCGLGMTASNPVIDLLNRFPEVVDKHLRDTSFEPAFDLDAELEDARQITGRTDPGAHIKGGGV